MDGQTESVDECINDMFSMIDTDGSNSITHAEFANALRALGTGMSNEDIRALIKEIDTDGDGDIDKDEFAELVKRHMAFHH